MLLAIDIGNSEITLGVWDRNQWTHHWRISSRPDRPELFYGVQLRNYFFESSLLPEQIKKIVLSSVVPVLTEKMENVVFTLFQKKSITMGPRIYSQLPVEVLNPYEIGSDLVANSMAAFMKYKKTCIVVDFGTALTFTAISGEGKILGVSIAPGLKTAIHALSQNTAKLFDVPLEMPPSALGKNTITAIQAGVLLGYVGLVKTMVETIRKELNTECIVIATGGLSSVITPLNNFFDVIEPRLTLDGLRMIGEIADIGTS
jgi:type III pantothenate kinase